MDDAGDPHSVFLWDKRHSYYLLGRAGPIGFRDGAAAIIEAHAAKGCAYAVIRCDAACAAVVPKVFGSLSPAPEERMLYRLQRLRVPDWREHVPTGLTMRRIDAALLANSSLAHRDEVRAEILSCWNTLEDFLQMEAGFCLASATEIVCWCTGEYASPGKIGFGIETVEEHRGRGYATWTASALAEQSLARGLTPYWDAWRANAPSLAVAEKVGFEVVCRYTAYRGGSFLGQDSRIYGIDRIEESKLRDRSAPSSI